MRATSTIFRPHHQLVADEKAALAECRRVARELAKAKGDTSRVSFAEKSVRDALETNRGIIAETEARLSARTVRVRLLWTLCAVGWIGFAVAIAMEALT